jgi:hypothetical protein
MFLWGISQTGYSVLGDDFLKEQHQQSLPVLHTESTLEPVIQQDSGIPPRCFRLIHGFFPQTSEKEPCQKKMKRLSSKTPPKGLGRPIFKTHGDRRNSHFTQKWRTFT